MKDYEISQIHVEIEWIKKKIESLKLLLIKKPSKIKEIRDLERQIRERELKLVFDKHS